jgi:ankyrin repeat protein
MWRIIPILGLLMVASITPAQNAESTPAGLPALSTAESKAGPRDPALIEAVKKGDLSQVILLLQNGISPDSTDENGCPALHWAVKENRRAVAEILLAHGAKVDAEDGSNTPLVMAAGFGDEEMVRLLLAHGAMVNNKVNSHSALLVASFGVVTKRIPAEIAKLILGEDSAAEVAAMGDQHLQIAKLLLSRGADANAPGEDCGVTPLLVAAMGGQVELGKMLLAHGAKADVANEEFTPLKFAEMGDSPAELQKMLDDEPDADTRQTLLKWLQLTRAGRKEFAELLRKAGARN